MPTKERRYKYETPQAANEMPAMPVLSEKKKKIAILLAVAAVAILIMSVVGLWAVTQKKTQGEVNIILPNATIQNETTATPKCYDDDCFLKTALTASNVNLCDQILNEPKRVECYEKLANQVLAACLKVSNTTVRNTCLTTHALKEKSVSLCKNLDSDVQEKNCIETIEPCYYKSGSEKLLCLALTDKDYKQCNKDELCIRDYTKVNKDINACKELTLPASQNACISILKGEDICGDLGSEFERDKCRLTYVMETHDKLACSRVTNDTEYAQECYTDLAVTNKEATYCNFLSSTDVRWNCLINYTRVVNDPKACGLVPDYLPKSYSNCWFVYATSNFETKGCTYITAFAYKNSCYERIFYTNASSLTPEKCAVVDTDEWKNRCYSTIGKRDLDLSACNHIQTEAEKKLCVSIVSSAIDKNKLNKTG